MCLVAVVLGTEQMLKDAMMSAASCHAGPALHSGQRGLLARR